MAPFVACGVTAVSPLGAGILLSIYNYDPLPKSLGFPDCADWDAALPVGSILAIKEPLVRPTAQWVASAPKSETSLKPCISARSDHDVHIRIDSPTDIEILKQNAPELQDVKWKDPMKGGYWSPDPVPGQVAATWKSEGNDVYQDSQILQKYS